MYAISDITSYSRWVNEQDLLSHDDVSAIKRCVADLAIKPFFSLIMMPSTGSGEATHASVRAQIYPHWELFGPHNLTAGEAICPMAAYNAALARAAGEFIIAVPPGAILPQHALFELADALADAPEAWLLFSDEDSLNSDRTRCHPRFKTSWDPDLMLGRDGVGNLAALRATKVRALGGLRPPEAGPVNADALLYDLVLRLGWRAPHGAIVHVPAVLCHSALPPRGLSDAEAHRAVVHRHLAEIGLRARLEPAPLLPSANRVVRDLPNPAPLVSILVPTRDQADVLERCAQGVLSRTDYPDFELLIIDNGSCEPATTALFERLCQDERVRVLPCPGPFNFSAINNAAAHHARGDILVLLNSDTDVIAPGWLREMVSQAVRPEIGAVGAKLLYGDETVQHCGITMGPGFNLTHQLRRSSRTDPGPGGELALTRSVSSVTGACLAVRAALYREVGGLDAANLPVAFNDVDFCLRLGDLGYRNI